MARSKAKNSINPDILVRMGTMRPQEIRNGKGEHYLPVDKSNGKGGASTMTQGWLVVDRNFSSKTDIEAFKTFAPLMLKVSRNSPEITIKKSQGHSPEKADEIIKFFKEMPEFINLNDPEHFDPYSQLPVETSPRASAQWYIEDMRVARTQKVGKHKETANILILINENEDNAQWLRDALFILGEVPTKDDTAEEMYGAITDLVIESPTSDQRRIFVEVYLDKKVEAKVLDAQRWFVKAVSLSIIQLREDMYCYGATKLGTDQEQSVSQLMYDTDVYRSVKAAVSEKSDLPEDKEVFEKVAAESNGSADEVKGIAWVGDKSKEAGLYKNPGVAFKNCNTISEAVEIYNGKILKDGMDKSEFITAEDVTKGIS